MLLAVVIVVLFATVVIAIIIVIITIVIGLVVSCTNSRFYNSSPIHSVTTLATRVIQKLHLLLFYPAEMATHGKMSSFDPDKKQWT